MKKILITVSAIVILISCNKEEVNPTIVTPVVTTIQNLTSTNSLAGDYQVISRSEFDTLSLDSQYVSIASIYPNCQVHDSYSDTAYFISNSNCGLIYSSDYTASSDSLWFTGSLNGAKYTLSNDTLTIIHNYSSKIVTTIKVKQ